MKMIVPKGAKLGMYLLRMLCWVAEMCSALYIVGYVMLV